MLPALSLSVAPFKFKAFKTMATPSVSVCPLTMVVVKTKALVPEPDTYVACTVLLPTNKASVGVPPEVLRMTTSLKLRVAFKVSPALRRWFRSPVAPLKATVLAAGASVSMLMLGDRPAVPKLPAASW